MNDADANSSGNQGCFRGVIKQVFAQQNIGNNDLDLPEIPPEEPLPAPPEETFPKINFKNPYVDFEGRPFQFSIEFGLKSKRLQSDWKIGSTEYISKRPFKRSEKSLEQQVNGILDRSMNGKIDIKTKFVDSKRRLRKAVLSAYVKVLPAQELSKESVESLGRIRKSQSELKISRQRPFKPIRKVKSLLTFHEKNDEYKEYKKNVETYGFFVRCPRPAVPVHQLKLIPKSLENWGGPFVYCSPMRQKRRSSSTEFHPKKTMCDIKDTRETVSENGCSKTHYKLSSDNDSDNASTGLLLPETSSKVSTNGSSSLETDPILGETSESSSIFKKCISYHYGAINLDKETSPLEEHVISPQGMIPKPPERRRSSLAQRLSSLTKKRSVSVESLVNSQENIPIRDKRPLKERFVNALCPRVEMVGERLYERASASYYYSVRIWYRVVEEYRNVSEGIRKMNRENR